MLRDTSRFGDALAAYREVLEKAPNNAWALNGLGQVLRLLGDLTGALVQFEAAAVADPQRLSFKLDVATQLRDAGRFADADRIIHAVLAIAPNNLDALLHRGVLERSRGDHEAALASFSEACRRHPESARPLIEMAIEERMVGRPAVSFEILKRAVQLEPTNLSAIMELAEYRWLEDDIDGALEVCRKAIRLHPNTVWPYLNACRGLADLGKIEEALRLLDVAEESLGRHPDLLARRISVLRKAGQWHPAHSAAQDAAAQYPRQFPIWQQKVELDLALASRDHAAIALADPPIGSVRDATTVAVLNGRLHEDGWQLREAIKHYEEAIKLNPECVEAHDALARLNLLQLDISESRRHLQLVMDLTASALSLRGHLLRASQSHLGQLLNEFALDQVALRELISISSRPPSDRIERLRRMIAENPDHTPIAICLFIALRQAGFLSRGHCEVNGSGASSKIPRRIIQYWHQNEPPTDVKAIMGTWVAQNGDVEYLCFDDKSAQDFLRETSSSSVLRAYRSLDNPAQKADIFRLAYLISRGGIYADADDRAVSPINTIVPSRAEFIACQEDHGTIGNNVLGSAPGNPVIERALCLAADAVNRGDRDMIWLMTGPGLLTRAAAQVLSEGTEDISVTLKSFSILVPGELRRVVVPHCSAQYKRTRQHWLRRQFSCDP